MRDYNEWFANWYCGTVILGLVVFFFFEGYKIAEQWPQKLHSGSTLWNILINYLDNYIFFVLLFKLVGGRNVRARLLPQIYVALLTPPGSGFKRWQGSQIGKEKKGLVKWGLITIFCLLKNISEETSDFPDTLSLSGDPKGEPLAGKRRRCF